MDDRETRYQGAIIRNHHILLLRHHENKSGRSYWILPGGGIEPGETEEECLVREMKEETNLDVRIGVLLLIEPCDPAKRVYSLLKTYLCEPDTKEPSPGFEPEPEAASQYSIAEVKWFDLRDESDWNPELIADPLTYAPLRRLRRKLGYLP